MKKKGWLAVFGIIIAFAAIWAILSLIAKSEPKGIEGMYEFNSDKTVLRRGEKSVTLTGEEREKVISYITQGETVYEEPEPYDYRTFDIQIDFCNGNVGYLSTTENVFYCEVYDRLPKEYCEYIASLIQ